MRFRRALKSRHIWSRSGGPSPPGRRPSCFLLSASGLWPERGSFSDKVTPRRLRRETSMLAWSGVIGVVGMIAGRIVQPVVTVIGMTGVTWMVVITFVPVTVILTAFLVRLDRIRPVQG